MKEAQENKSVPKNSDNRKDLDPGKFGTFKGVYLPSVLTILGVIMFLRTGWVVGNVGVVNTIIIVTISTAITFITGLSISSIATNMNVKVGGAYYMVSRTFGLEAGSGVGIPLYLAQAVGISFYIVGFAESLTSIFPGVSEKLIGLISLFAITVIAYVSAKIALKVQLLIFLIIIASLLSLFLGGTPEGGFEIPKEVPSTLGFWPVFAVFFPAVTGILSGVSMSGDLKDPSRALPVGTFAAILSGYAAYLAVPIFLFSYVPREVLLTNDLIIADVAVSGKLIYLGIWGATLSSALGSLLGAPRTLQALGRDRVVPTFLGSGFGPLSEPRVATALSFMIAVGVIILGDLNTIAPVLTMFFLTTYGMLNLIAGVEGAMGNPSWRPSFKTPWSVSLTGAFLCLAVMLMLNPGATYIATIVIVLIYFITAKRSLNPRWADIRRAMFATLARTAIYRLAEHKPNPRSWRPNIFLLSGAPTQRMHLVEFADSITHGKGFLTVAAVIKKGDLEQSKIINMEESIRHYLKERKIPALSEVSFDEDFFEGASELIRSYGLGPIAPNIFLFGKTEKKENFLPFARLIKMIYRTKRNLIVFKEGEFKERIKPRKKKETKEIICWWGGKQNNAGLMLTLGYMIQSSPEWRGANMTLKTLVNSAAEKEHIETHFKEMMEKARILGRTEVIIDQTKGEKISNTIKGFSSKADLVFLGMRPPMEDEAIEDYAAYYERLLSLTEGFPPLALLLSGEELNFKDILS